MDSTSYLIYYPRHHYDIESERRALRDRIAAELESTLDVHQARNLHGKGFGLTGASRMSKTEILRDCATAIRQLRRDIPRPGLFTGHPDMYTPELDDVRGTMEALGRRLEGREISHDDDRHAISALHMTPSEVDETPSTARANLDELARLYCRALVIPGNISGDLAREVRGAVARASWFPTARIQTDANTRTSLAQLLAILDAAFEAISPGAAAMIAATEPEPTPEPTPEPKEPEPMPTPTEPTPAPAGDLFAGQPTPTPAPAGDPLSAALAAAVQPAIDGAIGSHLGQLGITAEGINRKIGEAVAAASIPRTLTVTVGDREPVDVGITHKSFDDLLACVEVDRPVYLHGPAGSGKSYAAAQAAKATGRTLCTLACVEDMDSFSFTGYRSAVGEYIDTEFYRAWCGVGEFDGGALIFIDEFDRAPGGVSVGFNQALADSHLFVFPSGQRDRHPNTRLVLAGNTLMLGADGVYGAGQAQDGSTRDRCAFISWGYDEAQEAAVAAAEAAAVGLDAAKAEDWLEYVRSVRAAIRKLSMDYIVGPRATYDGIRILGATRIRATRVRDMVIWNKIEDGDEKAIKAQMKAGD